MTSDPGVPPTQPTVLHLDSRGIQVLAHPLRSRLLTALRSSGPATATALAARLDTNTGATSYHLRKLADVGLVTDTGEGRGRERWWRAATEMHHWSDRDLSGDSDALAASAWLRGQYLRHFVEGAEKWLAQQDRWPIQWRAVSGSSDYGLVISANRMERMHEELYAVINRYLAAGPGDPDGERPGDGEALRVFMFLFTHPAEVLDVPAPDAVHNDTDSHDLDGSTS